MGQPEMELTDEDPNLLKLLWDHPGVCSHSVPEVPTEAGSQAPIAVMAM